MRTRRLLAFPLLALAVQVGGALWAETAGVEAQVFPDREEATIGDRIGLTIEVTHPAEVTLSSPVPILKDGSPFRVEGLKRVSPEPEENSDPSRPAVSRFHFAVQAFETGEVELPAFHVGWSGPGGERGSLTTEPVPFLIRSVLEGAEEGLADLKPPVDLPAPPFPWMGGAAAILALLVLAVLTYFWRRRRKEIPAEVGGKAPGAPAHEQAYRELERLLASGMLQAGKFKEFHVELVEIVKRYLEGRFQIEALERTTDEVLVELKRVRLAGASWSVAREIFVESDLVKFAKRRPSEAEVRDTVELVYRLVDQTKSAPPPAPPNPAPPSPRVPSEQAS